MLSTNSDVYEDSVPQKRYKNVKDLRRMNVVYKLWMCRKTVYLRKKQKCKRSEEDACCIQTLMCRKIMCLRKIQKCRRYDEDGC
jgi:hypothetical protein